MASHGAMIAKTYGLSPEEYDALLKLQGGKCAICRARPVSKRLAVDHDHASGAVRGLLCSRCNHDLLGSAWDSSAMALALWHYMNTPPASGLWKAPELGLVAPDVAGVEEAAPGEFDFEDPTLGTRKKKTALVALPGTALPVLVIPDEWRELEAPALHALHRDIYRLLLEKDPPPF